MSDILQNLINDPELAAAIEKVVALLGAAVLAQLSRYFFGKQKEQNARLTNYAVQQGAAVAEEEQAFLIKTGQATPPQTPEQRVTRARALEARALEVAKGIAPGRLGVLPASREQLKRALRANLAQTGTGATAADPYPAPTTTPRP